MSRDNVNYVLESHTAGGTHSFCMTYLFEQPDMTMSSRGIGVSGHPGEVRPTHT